MYMLYVRSRVARVVSDAGMGWGARLRRDAEWIAHGYSDDIRTHQCYENRRGALRLTMGYVE